ncbi:hypothetical protein ANN_12397 [Periplaneta americana]|uniref:DUF4817 domain-containing protein n=1 Tax=Periplaneta americana TaxID=6978 RepID=A0ABQ8TIX5_PERAM|nr:hypothetical protein ANN_12397 [Periplaneta americana]
MQIRIEVVEAFIRLNSVIAVQRFFRQGHRHRVPERRTIVRWVQGTWKSGKQEIVTTPRTVRTPENVNRARAEMQRSPQRSERRHSLTIQISWR